MSTPMIPWLLVPLLAANAFALDDDAALTLGAELRLRHAMVDDARLVPGDDFAQTQLRLVADADARLNPHLRLFGQIGMGAVAGRRDGAPANFRNAVSLQQLWVEVGMPVGSARVDAIVGRQEFAEGPRQLISVGDGPNLHRTWNGARIQGEGGRWRVSAFDLRATRLGAGGFDEAVDPGETLQGLTGRFALASAAAGAPAAAAAGGSGTWLEPFWFRTRKDDFRVAGRSGRDRRDTFGARLHGSRGDVRFDATLARQVGRTVDDRPVDAWGLFAVQSLALPDTGWKPRLTTRLDIASGGGAHGTGAVRDFHPLYASSNYLGEGQFLGLSNLLMGTAGVSLSPTPRSTLSAEVGLARRLREGDAVYAAGMRPYPGTAAVAGRQVGTLARLAASWAPNPRVTLRLNLEHLRAGAVLRAAGLPSGTYGYIDATFHY